MARLSGLQREVLSLYRQCLREVRKKPIVRGEILYSPRASSFQVLGLSLLAP
jgi:hypothetical protein